jgi:hypothetical protein
VQTARDGLRWHLIDNGDSFDWSSWIPMLDAAHEQKVQVIWDLFHYGWPDWQPLGHRPPREMGESESPSMSMILPSFTSTSWPQPTAQ